MSEVMTPMSFEQLVDWVLQEKKKRGTVFGQHMLTTQTEYIIVRCSDVIWRHRSDRQQDLIRR